MPIEIFVFSLIAISLTIFIFFLIKQHKRTKKYPYKLLKHLLSPSERSFYGVLENVVGNSRLIFTKVRVADAITPQKGLKRADWQRAFNSISSKHFDFLICEKKDMAILYAIELDDSSHGSEKSQKRDDFLNDVCKNVGLPLVRIKASNAYSVVDIQKKIDELLSTRDVNIYNTETEKDFNSKERGTEVAACNSDKKSSVVKKGGSATLLKAVQVVAAPECPKCGAVMIRRQAKSGNNAGQEFWGCSTFPKCRGVKKIDN
jgi:ssDNA-binding Zn-finger/Zn-ribbon topoisomerase 1